MAVVAAVASVEESMAVVAASAVALTSVPAASEASVEESMEVVAASAVALTSVAA